MNPTFKIYVLIDPRTNEIRYVGKTIYSLAERLKGHLREKHKCHKNNWIKELQKLGFTSNCLLWEVSNEEHWRERECYWIEKLRSVGCPLTNMAKGGEGGRNKGFHHIEETRNKISIATKRRFSDPLERDKLRKPKSEEHKLKLRTAMNARYLDPVARQKVGRKGRIISEEWRNKLSEAGKGRKQTEEWKKQTSKRTRGEKNPCSKLNEEQVKEIRKLRDEDRKRNSLTKLASQFGVSDSTISQICSGRIWRYVNGE